MSPLKELFARLQAGIDALDEALHGPAAERLLEKDIAELSAQIEDWQAEAAASRARVFLAEERQRELATHLRALEAEALACLATRGKKKQAQALAEQIARDEARLAEEKADLAQLRQQRQAMQHVLAQGEHKLRRLQQQLDTLRASETLQRAQAAIARRQGEDTPESALGPAGRARNRPPAKPAAGLPDQEVPEDAAEAVLARLRARAEKAANTASSRQRPRRQR